MADTAVENLTKVTEETSIVEPQTEQVEQTEQAEQAEPAQEQQEEQQKNDDSVKTIFDSVTEFNTIHPLSTGWALWYIKPATPGIKEDWKELLSEIVRFSSVEEFWGIYNNIPKVSELPIKGDYAIYRQGIRPEWEEEENKQGGKWFTTFGKGQKNSIDENWLKVVLGAIGEVLEGSEAPEAGSKEAETYQPLVMGLFLNVRKTGVRVELWTRTADNKDRLMDIGNKFKTLLNPPDRVEFTKHTDSMNKGTSRSDAKLTIY
ncbi:eukaryotic translation initiation factor 4E [Nadsonia fulvescens var. elongata DSM 6958]|uniref:Eukaryotic translation initiation factor 4E n=1 Tax=Nadsonia fulvescens var. elongata DSM 6958 TaxID=857566 RepID=A0A1E3PRB8_9ASCO|nr:eukaryotic translation initiation factor 4E [Nadsonia fulvescens var. elongata DSM 6958]